MVVRITLVALIVALGATTLYLVWQNHTRAAALQIVENCPMPPRGAVLIIESDWPGRRADEHFRCRHGHIRPLARPGSAT